MFNLYPSNFEKETPEIAFVAGAVAVAGDRMIRKLRPLFKSYVYSIDIDIFQIEDNDGIEKSIKKRMLNNLWEFTTYGEGLDSIKEQINSTNFTFRKKNSELCDHILSICPIKKEHIEEAKKIIKEFKNEILDYIDNYYMYCEENECENVCYELVKGKELIERYYSLTFACNIIVYNNICFLIIQGTTE